jgi:hypothetical protein
LLTEIRVLSFLLGLLRTRHRFLIEISAPTLIEIKASDRCAADSFYKGDPFSPGEQP